MVQSSDRISLWWAVMGSRVNAAGTEVDKKREAEMQSQQMIQFVDSTLWQPQSRQKHTDMARLRLD